MTTDVDDKQFWREDTAYPFIHYVVAGSFYFMTRRLLLSLYAGYVWESIEVLLVFIGLSFFLESRYDSLLGDIIIDTLSIVTLYAIDVFTGWHHSVLRHVPFAWRIAAFVLIAAASFIGNRFDTDNVHFGVIIFATLFVVLAVAVYAIPLIGSGSWRAIASVVVWLSIGVVQAAAIVLFRPLLSIWLIVFTVGLMILLGVTIGLALIGPMLGYQRR